MNTSPYMPSPAYVGGPAAPTGAAISTGDTWHWAWSQIRKQPLLLAPFSLWVFLSALVCFGGIWLISSTEAIDNHWGIPLVFLFFFLLSVARLFQARATLVVIDDTRLRPHHLVTLPHAGRAIMMSCVLTLLYLVAAILFSLTPLVAFFLLLTTRFVIRDGLGGYAAMKRSASLMSSRSDTVLPALALFCLHILGAVTLVGWVLLIPVIDLMTTRLYMQLGAAHAPQGSR